MADAQAEVYQMPQNPEEPEFLGVYGCTYKYGRSYFIGPVPESGSSPLSGGGVIVDALAGSIAADWESGSEGGNIEVRDLRNGRLLHKIGGTGTERVGTVFALVVKSDGAAAWISNPLGGSPHEVHVIDKIGSRVLATSHEIDRFSLALAGSTLYWTEAGKPFSGLLN